MKFITVVLAGLMLASAAFAGTGTKMQKSGLTVPVETPKTNVVVSATADSASPVAQLFVSKLEAQLKAASDVNETEQPVAGQNDPDALNVRVFGTHQVTKDGKEIIFFTIAAHTKGQVYPSYLGSGVIFVTASDITDENIAHFIVNVGAYYDAFLNPGE